jgi:hypothetical protein
MDQSGLAGESNSQLKKVLYTARIHISRGAATVAPARPLIHIRYEGRNNY